MPELRPLTAEQAWKNIKDYRVKYYDPLSAMYSGDHDQLASTAKNGTFWNRKQNCRIHVPIEADLASVSSSLLFSQEPTYVINRDGSDMNDSPQQQRLETLLAKNNIANKLNEGAETCAALGDVYYKLRWNVKSDYPVLDTVQPDQAWPEYTFDELRFVHFFTVISYEKEHDTCIRAYECYEKGKITMRMYKGTSAELGTPMKDETLTSLGYQPEIKTPIDDMLVVHIANLRPNRCFRYSMFGRSDLDGMRDMCDSLDEAYSSWMRDIRLAKARTIVPLEYLKKKPQSIIDGVSAQGAWEFDPDVETYVAMDIDVDRAGGTGITPSQFAIRSTEHQMAVNDLIQKILLYAGYSPQSFGLQIEGSATSGTALNIRERKSASTKNKKNTYWQGPLEKIFTAMVHLDSALYPNQGSLPGDTVSVTIADSMGADQATIAQTIELLDRAKAISTIVKIRMQHPDWSEKQITEEVDRVKEENQLLMDVPDIMNGDLEDARKKLKEQNEGGEGVDR